ncbi:MAG: CDP-glycerol glycerophosphotransferase family protein [Oscillospiraceae bacterium]|nr:CDP-glycerol glycerophosphotransferase family protein [Oscillospiraceae bacterium]
MKRLLAILFALCRVLPLQRRKVVLLRRFPQWGSLGLVGDYLAEHTDLRVVRIENWRRLSTIFHLATAGTVLLNDGFSPLAGFRFSKRARVIQLWHADGALKRWGAAAGEPFPEACRYTHVVCATEAIAPHWAAAFGVDESCVLPLGSPTGDALRALPRVPEPQVLYAPSFREDDEDSAQVLAQFDFKAFRERLPDAKLLVRLHPKLCGRYVLPDWVVDATQDDLFELLARVSCVVTDYSSIMVSAAGADVPVVIFAPDYDAYMASERGFFTDLRALPPGAVVHDFAALLDELAAPGDYAETRRAFVGHHLGACDGGACGRVVAELF